MRAYLAVATIAFTLDSALFLAKGNLGLTAQQIAELASTKWNANPDVARSLCQQRAETWIGVFFLVAAFALQLCSEFWPIREQDLPPPWRTVVFAVLLAVLLFVGASPIASAWARSTERDVNEIFKRAAVEEQKPR